MQQRIIHTSLVIIVKVVVIGLLGYLAHLLTSLSLVESILVIYSIDTLLFLFSRSYDIVLTSLWYAARRGRLF